jgi:hypothetical protein
VVGGREAIIVIMESSNSLQKQIMWKDIRLVKEREVIVCFAAAALLLLYC